MHKTFNAEIKAADNNGRKTVTAKVSTISVDRDGDVLIPDGCDATNFLKNPVVMLNHDYCDLPVGRCVDIKRTKDSLIATTEFAPRPGDLPESAPWQPDIIHSLYKNGFMSGFSVGFNAKPGGVRKASKADKKSFGDHCRQVFSKWDLIEYSAVGIPCNQDALTTAVSKGYLPEAEARKILPDFKLIKPEPRVVKVYYVEPQPLPRPAKKKISLAKLAQRAIIKQRGGVYAD